MIVLSSQSFLSTLSYNIHMKWNTVIIRDEVWSWGGGVWLLCEYVICCKLKAIGWNYEQNKKKIDVILVEIILICQKIIQSPPTKSYKIKCHFVIFHKDSWFMRCHFSHSQRTRLAQSTTCLRSQIFQLVQWLSSELIPRQTNSHSWKGASAIRSTTSTASLSFVAEFSANDSSTLTPVCEFCYRPSF